MSASIVHNALLDILQKDSSLDTKFSTALSGTASSSEIKITGTNTKFLTEVKLDDYVGKPTKGYRKVTKITSDITMEVESAFDNNLSNETIKNIAITKGFADIENIIDRGLMLKVHFTGSADIEEDVIQKIQVAYRFVIILIFEEPNFIKADERKEYYESMIKNSIDKNLTIGGTCIGNTIIGASIYMQNPKAGIYYGSIPLTVRRRETRGNR